MTAASPAQFVGRRRPGWRTAGDGRTRTLVNGGGGVIGAGTAWHVTQRGPGGGTS